MKISGTKPKIKFIRIEQLRVQAAAYVGVPYVLLAKIFGILVQFGDEIFDRNIRFTTKFNCYPFLRQKDS